MSVEIRESSLCALNAQSAAEHIAKMATSLVRNNLTGKHMPALMLWGPPGVGKSDAVKQAAKMVETNTSKRAVITDVRLLLFNPVDLRGIPVADSSKEFAVWLKPKIFMMDDSVDVINFLFLDELTAAPQSVQAAAYQIALDRTVGEHKLPDNCIVLAAGNRTTDRSVAYKMPKALANRLCHIEIEADFSAWKSWAIRNSVNADILGFLTYSPESLMDSRGIDDVAFPTPRSWEAASKVIDLFDGSISEALPIIIGCVGNAAATALLSWTEVHSYLPDMDVIFDGCHIVRVPTRPDVLYALVSAMINYAKRPETTLEQIRNSIPFGVKLPSDYAMLLFREYMLLDKEEDMKPELIKHRDFANWFRKNSEVLDI